MTDYSKIDPNFDRFYSHGDEVLVKRPDTPKEVLDTAEETYARLIKEDKAKEKSK